MKRNYPSDRSADIAEDSRIIEERLNELYPTSAASAHKIALSNKGYYISSLHHIRLDSSVKLHSLQGLVQYCDNLNYHYLKPYQALYLLDTRQLIVFFNELPLSLAEAYKLLLLDTHDATNYAVFSYLNRSGFYCLGSEALIPKILTPSDIGDRELSSPRVLLHHANQDCRTEPLFKIDNMDSSYNQVLLKLRELGPKNLTSIEQVDDDLSVVFDAYKRETFSKHKPRRGKLGCPDWHVVVCDQCDPASPRGTQLASFSLRYGEEARRKLLFALVDVDNTMSFVHFDPAYPSDLIVDHDAWPEQISAGRMTEADQF